MSQQGTPFGAITLLNQARMSGGTSFYWPLSKASAALVSAAVHASNKACASRRMRSSSTSSPSCARWIARRFGRCVRN
jgi:hypothetical protein